MKETAARQFLTLFSEIPANLKKTSHYSHTLGVWGESLEEREKGSGSERNQRYSIDNHYHHH